MSEDLTKRLPNQPQDHAELLELIRSVRTELLQVTNSVRSELSELRATVETRLHDTRPIWEKVQADIVQLQESTGRLETGQDSLSKDIREVRTDIRDMNRKLSIFNDNLVQIQADYRDIYDRVRNLERQGP